MYRIADMGRKPVGYRSGQRERSEMKVTMAPIGGLNARDPLAAMPEQDAYVLDNLFPDASGVNTRGGSVVHEDDLISPVETLMVYSGGIDGGNLLAVAGDTLWDVTDAGSASVVQAGFTNARMQYTMFSNAGAQRLWACNGVDDPFTFDGASYTVLAVTGVTGGQTELVYPFTFKHRLYSAANYKLGFYYLDVDAIQGAASYFDLTQVAEMGGYVVAIASITRDAGDGPDDNIVFITSRGELIVYEGYDPTDINAWALVGRYKTGEPIGRRCAFKYGGDVLLVTKLGLIPITSIMDGGLFDPTQDTVTAKLGRALTDQMPYKNVFGWQVVLHASNNMLILNVAAALDGSTYYQYVMNTITRAWCRFTGLNALCWVDFGDNVYFGDGSGTVFKADTGTSDNGAAITCEAKQAYSYFEQPRRKLWHNSKMLVGTAGAPAMKAVLNVDYLDGVLQYLEPPVAGAFRTQEIWVDTDIDGFAASLNFQVIINGYELRWYATEHLYEMGGLI